MKNDEQAQRGSGCFHGSYRLSHPLDLRSMADLTRRDLLASRNKDRDLGKKKGGAERFQICSLPTESRSYPKHVAPNQKRRDSEPIRAVRYQGRNGSGLKSLGRNSRAAVGRQRNSPSIIIRKGGLSAKARLCLRPKGSGDPF